MVLTCASCRIKTCRFVHRLVQEAGYRATLLHGERGQEEREVAMLDFRSGKAQVWTAGGPGTRCTPWLLCW